MADGEASVGPRRPFCGGALARTDSLSDTVGKATLTMGFWKKCLTQAGSGVAPEASCPSWLGVPLTTPRVCLPLALARLLGAGSHCLEVLPYLGPSLRKDKIPGKANPAPTSPVPGGTWQTGISPLSPSTLSQDIPDHEEHARCANPSGNAGIRHQGSVDDPGMGT